MIPKKIGIIGLGLIGGAIAKTVHRIHPQIEIVACDTKKSALCKAREEGIISYGSIRVDAALSDCRYIFLCAPVQENEIFLSEISPYLNDSCILTDAGSVKGSIHSDIDKLDLSACFIGGHPMAGSEKSGYGNATAYLFENAYYIITPGLKIAESQVDAFREFIGSLGCIPLIMTPEQHDFMTAAVSHLPHILASSLVNLVQSLDNEKGSMKSIAAGGFKDITRIASSSPVMWQEICLTNRNQIIKLLDSFIQSITNIKTEIGSAKHTEILDFFQQAKDYRDSLPIGSTGPIPSVFAVYCDLIDEAGGIATIATILASNNISMKNIGIIHNREFEDGVLRIEFYEEASLKKSTALLKKHHYIVYER